MPSAPDLVRTALARVCHPIPEDNSRSISLPAPDRGICITRLTSGGGGLFPPPSQNSETTDRIRKFQTAFNRSAKAVEGNLISLTSGSLLTSQVTSSSKCLTIWSIWFCRALEQYEMEISQYNDMNRIWDTSKYHPKLSVSIFKVKVIQGHEVKERSN